jgi:hypothetical protein
MPNTIAVTTTKMRKFFTATPPWSVNGGNCAQASVTGRCASTPIPETPYEFSFAQINERPDGKNISRVQVQRAASFAVPLSFSKRHVTLENYELQQLWEHKGQSGRLWTYRKFWALPAKKPSKYRCLIDG